MSVFDFFGKRKRQAAEKTRHQLAIENRDYRNIIDIADILTNGDKQSISDMELLARDTNMFHEKYKLWCDEMLEGECKKQDIFFITAYWLTGYDGQEFENPNKFGCFIDSKEETNEILWGLKTPIEKLGYLLSLDDISFTGFEYTDEVLEVINNYFMKKDYTLIFQDTNGNCYHLFIVKSNDYNRLISLGNDIDLKFSNKFR